MLHHSLLRMWSLCRNLIHQTIASLMAVAQVLLEEMESACEVYIAHDATGLGADRASRLCCRYQTNISMRWFPSEISILSNFAFCFVPIAVLGFVLMEKTKARHRCRLSHVGLTGRVLECTPTSRLAFRFPGTTPQSVPAFNRRKSRENLQCYCGFPDSKSWATSSELLRTAFGDSLKARRGAVRVRS